jgi:hypothetical protein
MDYFFYLGSFIYILLQKFTLLGQVFTIYKFAHFIRVTMITEEMFQISVLVLFNNALELLIANLLLFL